MRWLALVLLAAGCQVDLGVAKAVEAPAKKKLPPAPPAWLFLRPFGVFIEVPGDAELHPAGGVDAYHVISPSVPECQVTVVREAPGGGPTFAQVIADIEAGRNGHGVVHGFARREETEGGWRIEWVAADPLEPIKLLHGVDVRTVVGGHTYHCFQMVATEPAQACVSRACVSLRQRH